MTTAYYRIEAHFCPEPEILTMLLEGLCEGLSVSENILWLELRAQLMWRCLETPHWGPIFADVLPVDSEWEVLDTKPVFDGEIGPSVSVRRRSDGLIVGFHHEGTWSIAMGSSRPHQGRSHQPVGDPELTRFGSICANAQVPVKEDSWLH